MREMQCVQADLFAGALFINATFQQMDLYTAIFILLFVACIFTVAGACC